MRFLKVGLLCALTSVAVLAQATAQMHGVVQDMSGAAIAGAMVKATQTDTGISRTVSTETDGSYSISNLPLGPYQIEVDKQGFATVLQSGIVLQVGSNPAIPIALKVGAVSERVEVEANATQVETSTVGVGAVVENQRVLDLPLNGRQPTDLIALSGAAVQTSAAGSTTALTMPLGALVAVAGGDPQGVQYFLDGASHLNYFDGSGLLIPFPDALQEFKVTTSNQEAAISGRSGASVSAVMKSGTNSFHGDAFEFIRNSDVNSRDFFQTTLDGLKRNQFGGVLGGPIKKDKVFFFVGYQGAFVRQNPVQAPVTVPTPQMLLGDFTGLESPSCPGGGKVLKAPFGQNGFAANTIDPAMFSPAAVAIAKLLPAADNSCGTLTFSRPLSEDTHEVDSRVDYQVSEKQSLFAHYQLAKETIAVPYSLAPTNVLTASGSGADDLYNSFTLGDTYLISATKVNSARVYFDRVTANLPGAQTFGPQDVGIHLYTYQPNYLTATVTGGFQTGAGQFSENSFAYTTAFGANDDFKIVHGAHQFGFGGSITRTIEWSVAQAWSGGAFTFSGGVTGLGMGDFFLGDASQLRQANPNPLNLSQPFVNLYAQDTWKVTHKLTLNYGVNWAPFFGMAFQQGDVYNFSLANFYAGTTSKVVSGAPPGFTFPGDPGFPGKSGINSQYGHFDPRIGLAWDPIGDGKTAIRAGAGIGHDFINQELHLNTSSSLPFRLTVVQTGLINLDFPYPQGDPFPYNYNPKNPVWPTPSLAPCLANTCPPTFLPVPSNMKTHVQYSWNLGVQRQITPSWFAAATYLGTHITHVWNAVELNPAVYIPGNCAAGQYGLTAPGPCTTNTSPNILARRVLNLANPTANPLGYLTQYDDGGTQGYNGLLLSTNYRLHSGLTVNANYTWSHCIGLAPITLLNPGSAYIHGGYGITVPGANDRDADVGNCVADRRQIANLTFVYQTPRYSNQVARILATGWTLGTSIQARSGSPFTVVTGTNPDPDTGNGGNGSTLRPNQVLPNVYATNQGASCGAPGSFCEQWLNPAAFGPVAIGTFGNMGAYNLTGPAFWQWDMSLSRQFRTFENQNLQIRFESFNVTNSFRPGNPGTTVSGASTFGLITTDATPPGPITAPARVFQLAAKYVF
jgi:hypothetical protein